MTDQDRPEQRRSALSCWGRSRFAVTVFFMQTLFLILFAVFGSYDVSDPSEGGVPDRWFYPSESLLLPSDLDIIVLR